MRINDQDLSKEQNELAEILSDILFNLDPARTCCKENDMIEEYDSVACWIIFETFAMTHKMSLHDSIADNFACFWSPIEVDVINTIIEEYNKRIG